MGRRKTIKKCFGCGILYTWEKGANDANGVFVPNPAGAVRKVTLDTREIHPIHCTGKPDRIKNDSEPVAPVPPVAPSPVFVPPVKPVTPKEEPVTPKPDTTPELLTPAGREIYNLIEPAIVENFEKLAENLKLQGGRTINHRVEVITPDYTRIIEGAHRQSPELLRALSVKIPTGKPGIFNRPNVLLVGPAGTGKSTAAEHAAEALGLNFFPISVGPQTTKSDFFGFTDATGKPVWTVIREAFVDGGVLLIDEIDSASPGALTYINGLLANSKVSFPAGHGEEKKTTVENKHHDFCVVAAANTYCNGGSRMYVRNELDKATTDRFIGIDWAYDIDLEQRMVDSKHFSGNVIAPEQRASVNNHAFLNMPFGDFVWKLRRAQEELKMRLIYGTRKILIGCAMLDHGFSRSDVENYTLWFGVEADAKSKLLAHVAGQR